MAQFVQEYAALRWSAVAAFLVALLTIVLRLAAPVPPGAVWSPVAVGGPFSQSPAPGSTRLAGRVRSAGVQPHSIDCGFHESDAAHLMMCLVMLAMLVFPAEADPHAVRGVVLAMTVVFALLLVGRIMEWHTTNRVPTDRIVVIGYHVVAAAAMLYALSGHAVGGQAGGPAPRPALALAALFTADALAALIAAGTGEPRHWLGHPTAAASGLSLSVVPHLVMDLGTAYMLVAAASGGESR